MKKIHLLAVALCAVFSFSAIAAASAFAEPEWLVKGAKFSGELATETTGALKLIHLAGGFLEPEAVVECSGTFDGFILGESTEGLITKLLTSEKVEVTLTTPLICKGVTSCEKPSSGEDSLVVAENLPWLTTLSLMSTGELWLILFSEETVLKPGKPAYEISCLVLGSVHEVLCEGETSAFFELKPGLIGVFSKAELESEGLEGSCEEKGVVHTNVALQEGTGTLKLEGSTEEIGVSEGTEEA